MQPALRVEYIGPLREREKVQRHLRAQVPVVLLVIVALVKSLVQNLNGPPHCLVKSLYTIRKVAPLRCPHLCFAA